MVDLNTASCDYCGRGQPICACPLVLPPLTGHCATSAIMSAAKHELDVGPKTRSPPRKMLHRALVGVGLVLKKKARAPALPMR